jgi:hypothetical protein
MIYSPKKGTAANTCTLARIVNALANAIVQDPVKQGFEISYKHFRFKGSPFVGIFFKLIRLCQKRSERRRRSSPIFRARSRIHKRKLKLLGMEAEIG